jgi:hypothetical protein
MTGFRNVLEQTASPVDANYKDNAAAATHPPGSEDIVRADQNSTIFS